MLPDELLAPLPPDELPELEPAPEDDPELELDPVSEAWGLPESAALVPSPEVPQWQSVARAITEFSRAKESVRFMSICLSCRA